jgi:hypothetical protein
MAARAHSGLSAFGGFFIGVALAAVLALAFFIWPGVSREAPMRTVELSMPSPEIPAPPGTIPDAELYPPAP